MLNGISPPDDGVEFARTTFTVGTTATEFLRGVEADCRVADFSVPGQNGRFTWNESTQHLELAEAGRHVQPVTPGNTGTDSVQKWAEEWVDVCYRKADESDGSFWDYRRQVEACLDRVQKVAYRRLWRDRYVRDLVRDITEAGGLEAWLLEAVIDDCYPDGDINPDHEDCSVW